ncbi:MAG TPA: N-acetyltransferase [Pirellulales bacterium]|nr:N-acetyltransferase [Pirellulales bacterium]
MKCLKVRAVSSPLEWRRFLSFPKELYAEEPRWVPPLARDEEQRVGFRRHPFHDANRVQAFLAERRGQVVGRIAAIHNVRHNQHHGERRGFFGFFECRNDGPAARGLVGAAADWLAARGLTDLRGPMSPSIDYQVGVLVDGFDEPPSFMMPYNSSYYAGLLAECGLAKSQDLFALACSREEASAALPRLRRVAQRVIERHNVRIRPLDRWRFRDDLRLFLSVINRSLTGHWGHVPLSSAEMHHMALGMRWLSAPELALIAEIDRQPIGVALALPDYNPRVKRIGGRLFPFGFIRLLAGKRRIKQLRVVAANVLPEWKRSGMGVALTATMLSAALERGAEKMEFSWVAESNPLSHGSLETGGAQRSKTYRVYDTPIP